MKLTGYINTKISKVPRISANLDFSDNLGTIRARLALDRNNYRIEPGLYAVGMPDSDSPVLVSANYKLSFDSLRKEIRNINAWILVLDTLGINVWCAAGKGRFGTAELINRINLTGLKSVVEHARIVVPQLGATGVSAHETKNQSGFSVIYGPVRSKDLRAFLKNGMKASPEMRRVNFALMDRLTLVPAELTSGLRYLLVTSSVFFLLSGIRGFGYSPPLAFANGIPAVFNLISIYVECILIGPLLLPWLPGRAFSLKGVSLGILVFMISFLSGFFSEPLELIAWLLMTVSAASFMLMNFTGSSTYTSLSGVRKEMRTAVPLQAGGFLAGFFIWLAGVILR